MVKKTFCERHSISLKNLESSRFIAAEGLGQMTNKSANVRSMCGIKDSAGLKAMTV